MKRLFSLLLMATLLLTASAQTNTFPYPDIPTLLTTPSERATFLIEHYWDNYNFADTTLVENKEITEQGFVNFIDLLPRFDSIVAVNGLQRFYERILSDTTPSRVADSFDTMIEHYLSNPNSPMRNEELYIMFLQSQISTLHQYGDEAIRPTALLATALKNRLGTKAADFNYTTRSGQHSSLYATQAQTLLLIFYDPECEHCKDILSMLLDDSTFKQQVASGQLTVLAVYTEENKTLWQSTAHNMPTDWIVAVDDSNINKNAIYDIPAMPVFYLLDSNKLVVLKDPSIYTLLQHLSKSAS